MGLVIAVLAVSSIGAGLALLLVLAEGLILNYGPCQISINGGKRQLEVQGGKPLLTVLREQKIFIPSACGGRGTCGVCKVKVLAGGGAVLPTETPFLSPQEMKDNVRLSCQVKVRNDLAIEIPEHLFNVREYMTRCVAIEPLTYDMRRFRFELVDPPTIDFVPGQYMQLLCPRYKGSDEEVYRAYSIASDPLDNRHVDLIIRRVPNGICTTWCFDYLKEGQPVQMNGPYGEFRLTQTDLPMVFIAGGSGIAPFVSILAQMKHQRINRPTTFFFGGNTTKDLCLLDQMKAYEQALPNFKFVPVVARPEADSGWRGETGLVTQAVDRAFNDLSGYEGYLCGSPGMIDASIKVLVGKGMSADRIYYDKFA